MDIDDFSALVESIYDCSFDPDLWPQTLAEIAGHLRSSTARLFLFNNDVQRDGFGKSVGIDTGFNEKFDNDIETLNSIKYGFVVADLDNAMTLDEILGTNGGLDINGNEAFDNRYYKDWMLPLGYHDALAALMVKNSRHFGGLAMTRGSGESRFDHDDRKKISLIAPHIRRALAISGLIEQKTVDRNRLADVIDGLSTAVVIVDERGAVIHSNAAAKTLLSANEMLRIDKNVLAGSQPANGQALVQALQSGPQAARSVPLTRRAGGDLIASIMPLSQSGRNAPGSNSHSAIFFHDPDREFQLPGEALAKQYKLTGAELRLLLALAHGASLSEISERSGAAISTVRAHLRSLFGKTGKSRQSELVQMALMAILPIK